MSVSVGYIANLIALAVDECMDFFGKTEDGRLKLPRNELKIQRLETIENPLARSEGRPNAIGTNGEVSILEYNEQIPDPGDTIRKRWAEISRLQSVSKLLRSLQECGPGPCLISSMTPPVGMSYLESYCAIILSDVIIRFDRGKELDRWSMATAQRLVQAMTDPRHLSTIIAPLVNFYAESEGPIAITDRVILRSATDDEIEEFGVRKSIVGYALANVSGFVRSRPISWVVETSFMRPPDDGTPDLQALVELDAVVAAVRVLGDQFFDYPIAAFVDQPYGHASHAQPPPRTPAFQRWSPFKGPFILRASEISRAIEFARRVVPMLLNDSPNEIKIAVRRLRDSSTREVGSDMVVDGEIGMEAVLLRKRETQKGFRLATRAAVLVGGEPQKRKGVYDFVLRLSVGRGDLLHGRDEIARGVTAEEVLSLARMVVRRVVDETASQTQEDLIVNLDKQIVELSTNATDPLGRVLAIELPKHRL
jgi:hypothetical protein